MKFRYIILKDDSLHNLDLVNIALIYVLQDISLYTDFYEGGVYWNSLLW